MGLLEEVIEESKGQGLSHQQIRRQTSDRGGKKEGGRRAEVDVSRNERDMKREIKRDEERGEQATPLLDGQWRWRKSDGERS